MSWSPAEQRSSPVAPPTSLELLRACVLCNDAHLAPPAGPGEPWSGLGDPTELALLSAAGKAGLTREDLERVYTRIGEVPFDSATQRMTTAHLVTRSTASGASWS